MRTSFIVADGARARFLEVEGREGARVVLREECALINPEHDLRGHDEFPQPRGGAHGGSAGRPHVLDDHRAAHRSDADRRFAREVEAEAERALRERGVERFVVVAEPRALGRLRDALAPLTDRARIDEVPHDVAGRSVPELAAYLGERGLL